jgi:hypothetical protein
MKRLGKSVSHVLLAIGLAVALTPCWALEPAKGKVILTLQGKVGETNSPKGAVFDMAMLKSLPQQTFSTHTPWDKTPTKFQGPLLRDVLAAAKASGKTIKAVALNDYKTQIPMGDAAKFDVIVAHSMNGQDIPVRTKGPLFIVYPFDSQPELKTPTYYERSAWQLQGMEIE